VASASVTTARLSPASGAAREDPEGVRVRHEYTRPISQVDYLSEAEPAVFSDEFCLADAFSVTVYRKGGGRGN
jgi:hypothetical protein